MLVLSRFKTLQVKYSLKTAEEQLVRYLVEDSLVVLRDNFKFRTL